MLRYYFNFIKLNVHNKISKVSLKIVGVNSKEIEKGTNTNSTQIRVSSIEKKWNEWKLKSKVVGRSPHI